MQTVPYSDSLVMQHRSDKYSTHNPRKYIYLYTESAHDATH